MGQQDRASSKSCHRLRAVQAPRGAPAHRRAPARAHASNRTCKAQKAKSATTRPRNLHSWKRIATVIQNNTANTHTTNKTNAMLSRTHKNARTLSCTHVTHADNVTNNIQVITQRRNHMHAKATISNFLCCPHRVSAGCTRRVLAASRC